MSDKTNERLEREARESLVAADLSAKMKQWRDNPPPADGGGGAGGRSWLRMLFLCFTLGGAIWWLWPAAPELPAPPAASPVQQTVPAPQPPDPVLPEKSGKNQPMAQKTPGNHYLALAQSNYQSPDFAADIRGDGASGQNALHEGRKALAGHRPADALDALQNVPPDFETDAKYLRAHALFELKKYRQAANLFSELTGSVRYGEAAEWYVILALLPDITTEKPALAARLKKIAEDEGHTFQREAARLYRQL